ncbi:hypothetical protein V5F44_21335, partial [Xanthobacter sp. V2C-8]|uniref:hypothetical protein n=1 Tax=Xanthobacter albus TaxID=3119929 RepID=UPI00372B2821
MNAVEATVAAYSLAAYLGSADLVGATSVTGRASVIDEEVVRRSFAGSTSWSHLCGNSSIIFERTAIADPSPRWNIPDDDNGIISQ